MCVRATLSLALLTAFTVLTLAPTPSVAQTPEEEVRAAIDTLFDGMRAGDSTMVGSVFYQGVLMGRATDQGYGTGSPQRFLDAIGTPHDQVWDEQIWDVTILVDQRLASAWMEFAFYLGDTLHHCGVNSMQLYKTDAGWKITYLVDTDRGMDCDVPDEIREGRGGE